MFSPISASNMTHILTFLLVKLVMPIAMLLSIAIRPFGLSLVYLLLFLLSPFVRVPDSKSRKGFLIIVLVTSVILLLAHIVWHSVLASFGTYGSLLENQYLIKRIGHNIGLVAYVNIDPLVGVHYIAPELVMTATSLMVFVAVSRLRSRNDSTKLDFKYQTFPLLVSAGKYLSLFLIMFSGILSPSVTSGIYFLMFMGAATMWALGRLRDKAFAVVARCVMAIMVVHSVVLFAYQNNWITDIYPPDEQFARYFGVVKLVDLDEKNPNSFSYVVTNTHQWGSLTSPMVILVTYYILAIETRELFKPKVVFEYIDTKTLRGNASETTPLIVNVSASKRWSFRSQSKLTKRTRQDSTGSVVLNDDESDVPVPEPTLTDEIIHAIIEFFQVLVRSSYIATTITMMAWSILFHSWLTFVFLMWANIVWLCQNQRKFMLQTSPVLVIYAMALLIVQYVYAMNLTESELPSNITSSSSNDTGLNLNQIGIGRPPGEPFVPLLIKSLFTCMFWVTLRQRVQEMRARRQAAALADMAAPLQLTVSTAASVIEGHGEEPYKSRILVAVGNFLKAACARYWIYVVAIMLFVFGITGERMTIFRIIYMFLFLAFIVMFQISWYWWRRLMYAFWIVVIVYSMINLILLYVYQFDKFSGIIENYLFINVELQHDLGLEFYKPSDLFLKLLTPTLFLIITIMQVHYFHKDFMALSDFRSRTYTHKDAESSRRSQGASTIKDDIPQLPEDERRGSPEIASGHSTVMSSYNTAAKLAKSSPSHSYGGVTSAPASVTFRTWCRERFATVKVLLLDWVDAIFEYLDIHLNLVIFVALMLLCVFNVCAMHVPIMIINSFTLTLSRGKQRVFVLVISILISVYFMAKMVYQIEYIKHDIFASNCSEVPVNASNNAEWVGFTKASPDRSLVVLLKGYTFLIAIFTFNSLVKYRQQIHRELHNLPVQTTKLMFPNITRKDADKDLLHCIKYLVNYGFYKFGVEVTLICLIGVIGSRMDVYAVMYAFWLLGLVAVRRPTQARVWGAFTAFLTVVVPFQYLLAVGFLPELCVRYPWSGNDEMISSTRDYMYLPYAHQPPHATKLIFDYFLLVFATLQLGVFHIESTHGDAYPGGSNSENIGADWETPTFENPVPDFLGFVGTWLDIFKRMVFLGMLWVTLAIMFMTGTNRVNLFSIGYLVGSFIFLWQGTDFYLLPKESILKWWSWLLRYNVMVVVVKTLLQIPGCIFSTLMHDNACWLVQVLGIGCVDKFVGGFDFTKLHLSGSKKSSCSVPQEDIGLAWDGVCFAFLILQRRLFHSHYFYRVIDESKATTVLASRGAELIEELRMKQMQLQEEQELTILEKIKVKMEKIKANQKKIQGVISKEPDHHDAGNDDDVGDSGPTVRRRVYTKRHEARECPTYRPPASHQKAVRSGDYYMFDDFDDTDEPIKEIEKERSDDEAPKEMGLGKLVSTVFKTDLRRALSLRRASMPAVSPRAGYSASLPHSYAHETRSLVPSMERIGGGAGPPDEPDAGKTIEEFAPTPEKETGFDKLRRVFDTVGAFASSFLVSLTRQIMRYSRDYRYVSRTLTLEKKVLKEKEGFGIGMREGSQMRWEPLPETLDLGRKLSDISVPEIRILAPSMERGLDGSPPSRRSPSPSDDNTSEHESAFSLQSTESKDVSLLEEHDDSMFKHERSPLLHLLFAAWYAVLAHTDIVCYIMVFINQIQSATILSIPLPIMVFLWGTLTIPRPTKTFWVTLIAYTEVIVLIKSMFQFEILPWNHIVIPASMPFNAPRIIGIERTKNYALYDLLLLLIIFLHRFMLKSLGLWKETTPEIELREDMEFPLDPHDTQMLVEGRGEEVAKKYLASHHRSGPTQKSNEETDSSETSRDDKPLRDSDESGPSKPPDDHFNVNDDQEPIIAVTTTMDNACNHFPGIIWLSFKRYMRPTVVFFKRMMAPGARVTADVYAYMFLCDFFNFLVVIFGFAAFGTQQGDGGVQSYLEENKVPIPFLVMLILQFILIVVDRALYLRKYMLGKILFQYTLIIGVHIWMFFILPFITERAFNTLTPPPLWYMVKCVYLLLSAYQIRCGYPRRIIGNFLCKSYRFLNMLAFRCFMAVPFVFELRTLMDWIWTDTSMTLNDWLKMEDIFANVFLLKCSRYMEDEFPAERGAKKSNLSKYLLGGTVLAFVIAIIWFPLVFFAFGNTVGQPNPPTDVTVKIRIGAFLPIYQMSAQPPDIETYTESDYVLLSNLFSTDRTAQTFLSNYMYNDVAVISLNPNSTMQWAISPPELERLESDASSSKSLTVKFTFVISRISNTAQNPPTIEDSREVTLKRSINGKPNKQRDILLMMLNNTLTDPDVWLEVDALFPKFLKVFNKGTAKPTNQLILPEQMKLGSSADSKLYHDVKLRLERTNSTMYWRVQENCPDDLIQSFPRDNCDMLVMFTFNDKLFPETLNFISGGGIIGLYTTFVFLASRVIRGFFSGIYTKIMFDDLPNVDRVLQLCLDIYLVREAIELALEEDLFAKLVFMYRSPETMIKWSRPKEEGEEQRPLPAPPQ